MDAITVEMTTADPKNTGLRGFWSLSFTQFQESFSDNAYRWLVLTYITALGLSGRLALASGVLFSLPFILFSMTGGYLADRYSKRSVIVGTKTAEIPIMALALVGLALGNVPVMLIALFLRSTQSACFSPSKFGLLPELLPESRISWGNGVIELGSFLAIICGTVAGPTMYGFFSGRLQWAGAILIGATLTGLLAAIRVSRVPAAGSTREFRMNPLAELGAQLRIVRKDRTLFLAVLGNTYFFFLAALLQYGITFYGRDVLGVSAAQTGYFQAAVAIGIGIGSLAAGYVSGNKIEYGLIPIGAAGMTGFAVLLARTGTSLTCAALNLALLGFCGGFFAVPVNAIIQHRPDAGKKGGVIAAANLLSFVGILLAACAYYVMSDLAQLTPRAIFLAGGLMTLAATVYAIRLVPDALLRLVMWVLVHSIYRIRVEGRGNIPEKGGALFVCNHLSLIDALLLSASTDRQLRFLIYQGIYDRPLVRPFAKLARAIPISSEQRPRDMIRSLRTASQAIRDGEVVCIFAEGQMTRIGRMLPFRRGLEKIMKGVDAPIVPVHLDGVWGSIFSFERGRYFRKMPKRALHPITVSYGAAMPPASTAVEVRQAVQELQSEAYRQHPQRLEVLPRSFVRTARRHPFRFAMADANTKLRFGSVLIRAVYLAGRLKEVWSDQDMAGILLPPSIAGALVNFAALLCGKIPVNLNYTLSSDGIASCAHQCSIRTIVTSRAFLERIHVEMPGNAVFLEDIVANPRVLERLKAIAIAWTFPAGWIRRALGSRLLRPDDLATVIFSSGSTGEPKGVMLTHHNISSNIEQLEQCIGLRGRDRILGVLPFFHSFGFTGTLALPLSVGTGVVFHPNPFDARTIGTLTAQYRVSLLVATPTFLQSYTRRCDPGQFGSLKLVLVGAEKLQEQTAQAFEDRFGIRPHEAYGCTECSPAVAVNTLDFRAAGFRQVGGKRGKIGHALPGISVRIVDPETLEPVPIGQPGLLLVRGPNVMKGYLGKPAETTRVLRDGWYVTGDIAAIDEDGFLEITDRLSRFSKIGGEMIPHIRVEEKLHELANSSEQVFAVTGVPDEKKGERLLVLHTLPG
jgi:acyl-[acyl-carrier-protein]-phospholipid O-acyltransferase / long-chain-fatty-acid--[acyl-carrier-protein] ligase